MFSSFRLHLIPWALCAGLIGATGGWGALNVNVLDLDGAGDYVQAADADNLTNFANGAFTLQAWVYLQQLGINQPIISKYVETGNQRSWGFLVTNTGQLRAYVSGNGTAAGTYMWQTWSPVVTADAWHHVAFVCDPLGADKIKFYVDNVMKDHTNAAQNPPGSVFNSTAAMWVGRFVAQYFYGFIDEVRVDASLISSFPSSIYDLPLNTTGNTAVLYHFDEAAGNALDPSIYPANDGTFMGGAGRRAWDGLGPSNDLPLPVSLISLAALGNDASVTVNWATETEIDNLGYHLYRSTNHDAGYSRINSELIPSQGFSATTQYYQYVDARDLINGVTYYYKISDVDVNGREREHETVAGATPLSEVLVPGENGALAGYQLSQNYPNPFNAVTVIRYYVRNAGMVHLAVYNMAGKEVAVLANEIQSAGEHAYEFDASPYPTGIYLIRLAGVDGYDNIKKMLFLK